MLLGCISVHPSHLSLLPLPHADLACLQARIPLLVRSIWGQQSEAVVGALRQRRATAQRLIAQWEEAEHRLVAVANSLATLQNGQVRRGRPHAAPCFAQVALVCSCSPSASVNCVCPAPSLPPACCPSQKLIAVGVPLAAAQLWPRPAYAYSAAAVEARRQPRGAGVELTLGQLSAQVARLAAALREELAIALRGLYLFCLFLPAVATAPVLLLGDAHRQRWLDLVRWTLENAGPAFIKWGQWAATRPDLFPQDACDALAALQTKAPTHAYRHTVAAVESSLGEPLHELFSEFEAQPVASGSIAQVGGRRGWTGCWARAWGNCCARPVRAQ